MYRRAMASVIEGFRSERLPDLLEFVLHVRQRLRLSDPLREGLTHLLRNESPQFVGPRAKRLGGFRQQAGAAVVSKRVPSRLGCPRALDDAWNVIE